MKKTAVVILNWNGKKYLEMFFRTIVERTEKPGIEVIVADNGSTDDSVDWLKENFPSTRLILFDRNYGYTGGYNKALAQIEADYYVLLNSDVEVEDRWIDPLIDYLDAHPECAAAMPKVRSYYNRDDFEYAGACGGYIDMFGYPFCRGRILSSIEKDEGQYDSVQEVFWASGVALTIRAEVYHRLGGLDDNFFAHMEEIDLCWRIKLEGYTLVVVPDAVIYHVGGGTLPNNSPRKLYLNFRNNLLMMYKNLPTFNRHIILFIRKVLDGGSALVYLLTGNFGFFKAVFQAHMDYYKIRRKLVVAKNKPKYNKAGIYKGSIVFRFFLSRCRLKFSQLGFRLEK